MSGIAIGIGASNNVIGGTGSGVRNLISGNDETGVLISEAGTSGNIVQGNYIGTDVTGALPLANAGDGVHIQNSASSNLVGGTANGAGNLIASNGWSGVRITAGAFGNTVQGNTIGTDPGGTLALGNAEQGVSLNGSDNQIGGTEVGAANHIAHNTGNGVYVETGTGNTLAGNLVWDNGALGIDLDPPGITPNDTGDADSGPNNLQNFPLLTSVSRNGASTLVEGTLNSTPNTTYRLEFFANTACDPSGNGEGESYLGSQDVATDANGNASFSAILPAGISGGAPVSATATDPGGNTSEFSACRESISGAYSWHYQYDALYRLTGAYYSDGTYFRYTYDAVGNRLSEETVTGTITYTYDSANRLASVDGVPYTWDNNGNLLSDGLYTYTFNHANQLVGVSGAGTTLSYGYNGQGDRVSQTAGITTTSYTLDLAAGLTQVLADGTDAYLYGNGRIAQYDTFGAQYFLGDALGSVRQLVDANGEVLLAQSYEPYGVVLESAGEGTSSYGFAAEMRDPTGLIYLRARYLDTYLNQFIQPDPIVPDYSNPQNLNAYSYVRNNPINLVDPSGKCVSEDCVDNDHRNLTYWLINAMKLNSQSDEVDRLRQLNRLGNLDIAATLADLIKRQITGEVDITDCDLISAIWDFSTGMPKDVFKREAYTQWTDLVKKGARWDFKKRVLAELGDSVRLCGMNGCSSWFNYDVIANIHFGYVGRAAGFTSLELHIGAGKAQAKDSPGTGKWYTLGDEPADYWAVEMGIYLYHYARPAGLNALWFKIALDTFQSHLKSGKRPKTPYYNYTYGFDEELGPMFPVDYFNGDGEG